MAIKRKKKSKSRVNEAGNYTKPTMRKRLFNRIKAGSKGGRPGQWSARKAQMLAAAYKKQVEATNRSMLNESRKTWLQSENRKEKRWFEKNHKNHSRIGQSKSGEPRVVKSLVRRGNGTYQRRLLRHSPQQNMRRLRELKEKELNKESSLLNSLKL